MKQLNDIPAGVCVALALSTQLLTACMGPVSDPWPSSEPWPTLLPENREDGSHLDPAAGPFYEGWYHKVSVPDREEAFFFIYGLLVPGQDAASRPPETFLYCGSASTLETVYQSFPVEDYSSARGHRDVRIGGVARTTALRFAGKVEQDGHRCSWDIVLDDGIAWENTMGWLTGLPGLETYWTVGTMMARASGWVRFDGRTIQFKDALGYGDHNWGIRFPREWIWLQSNAFPDGKTALALSGGTAPMGETEIDAHLIGLLHDGELHTFRVQDFDAISAEASKGWWEITGEGRHGLKRITVSAVCDIESLFHLLVATSDGMKPHAWESLVGTVTVVLERRASTADGWHVVFQGTSKHAGVELGE